MPFYPKCIECEIDRAQKEGGKYGSEGVVLKTVYLLVNYPIHDLPPEYLKRYHAYTFRGMKLNREGAAKHVLYSKCQKYYNESAAENTNL